jgi:hypothetical protein
MMKKLLSIAAVFTLATSVMAGGDDRDTGPVESLDAVMAAPSTDSAVGNQMGQSPETLKLSVGGKSVSIVAHIACQSKLGLSESNIAIFKQAQTGGYLYNTGPINTLGTEFSPKRWDEYFTCVDAHGG